MMPGIKNINPGAANSAAKIQCSPQTSMAPKKAPMVIGNVNLKSSDATKQPIAHKAPRCSSIPEYPAISWAIPNAIIAKNPSAAIVLKS